MYLTLSVQLGLEEEWRKKIQFFLVTWMQFPFACFYEFFLVMFMGVLEWMRVFGDGESGFVYKVE